MMMGAIVIVFWLFIIVMRLKMTQASMALCRSRLPGVVVNYIDDIHVNDLNQPALSFVENICLFYPNASLIIIVSKIELYLFLIVRIMFYLQ